MTADADIPDEEPAKKSKMPLIIGLVMAVAGGGCGFLAVQMGFIGGTGNAAEETSDGDDESAQGDTPALGPGSFVALDTIVINLPGDSGRQFLRFTAQLEVPPSYAEEVEGIKPRIIDVLNSYLRAVDIADLEDPAALIRLRSQMLRRVQVVTGDGRVTDLLITEFVLN